MMKHKNRKPTSFTLSIDTMARLDHYAKEHHTNKSQAITDLIWSADFLSIQHIPTEDDLAYMSGQEFANSRRLDDEQEEI